KFELFIFDVLPLARRWTVVETSRREEFEPLKNATGPDSPETVRRALSDLAADWLERARAPGPRPAPRSAAVPLGSRPLSDHAAQRQGGGGCAGRGRPGNRERTAPVLGTGGTPRGGGGAAPP